MAKKGKKTQDDDISSTGTPKKASQKIQKKSAPIQKEETKKTRSGRTTSNPDYDFEKMISYAPASKFEAPMLASTYDGSQNIDGWFMSEKLDGVRCIWDGKHMWSRNGNRFYPPDFFINSFPNVLLDGELFTSRKNFSEAVSIVKKQEPHDGWNKVKFIVFDGPKLKGTFKSRMDQLENLFSGISSPYIGLHEQQIVVDKEALEKKMDEIVAVDGEGIIVRDPNSLYENRRSKTMLKVKRFHDAEAVVLSHHKGTGRLSHTMGAIEVINNDGITFRIGSGFTDKDRSKPPKIGSVVTYRYFELSKDGVPRFPTYMREHPGF